MRRRTPATPSPCEERDPRCAKGGGVPWPRSHKRPRPGRGRISDLQLTLGANASYRLVLCDADRTIDRALLVGRRAARIAQAAKAVITSRVSEAAIRHETLQRSEEHTSELQSQSNLVRPLPLEK